MTRRDRIKDHHAEQNMFTRRAVVAAILMCIAIAALIGRLAFLQVLRYNYFADLSRGNRIRIEPIPPNRGLILDRNGLPLAVNTPSYQLELVREQVHDLDATLRELAALQLLDRDDVAQVKRDIKSRRSFEAVPLKLQMTDEQLARFAVRRHDFPGVEIRPRLTRRYPMGSSAVHAVGYVSSISEDDQKRLNMDEYAGTTLTGKTGVERSYEQTLHGNTGYQQLLVNAQGKRVDKLGSGLPDLKRREALAGDDVYLTINERVQHEAEEMMRGKSGAVVAMDPRNGDIIALVSAPGFDPNLFVRGISRSEYRELLDDIDQPMNDRALTGAYPSGSTIKPYMAFAALQTGVVTAETSINCPGYFRLGGSTHSWKDLARHGPMDMVHAIKKSCNVYFYTVSTLMGIDRIHDNLQGFGFGAQTGIDIEGEQKALLPSAEWKRKAFKRKEMQAWLPGDTPSVGIGQGYLTVTPLQIASATATIAMRGHRFKPRMVHAVRDAATGKIVERAPVEYQTVQAHDPAYWDVIITGMEEVVKPGGTASVATAGVPYRIAAKTGTAQAFGLAPGQKYNASQLEERLRDHAWFEAFAPADDPRVAISVIVENGGHGGTAAAPIARRIFDMLLLTPEELAAQDAKRQAQLLKQQRKPSAPAAAQRPDDESEE